MVALTFAPMPQTGVLDPDLLYRVLFAPGARVVPPTGEEHSLKTVLDYFAAVQRKYLDLKASEVRVRVDRSNRAKIDFLDFPGGTFSQTIDTNKSVTLKAPDGSEIKVYVGGRDDAFFNDLPGFFRSINYAPQFYKVPQAMTDMRELPIPKTLLELDGNTLFNFDPQNPKHGQGVKLDLPPGQHTWTGKGYKKDANGNYRFVYSGVGRASGLERQRGDPRAAARLHHQITPDRPDREHLGRELGAEGVGEDRADPGGRRPASRQPAARSGLGGWRCTDCFGMIVLVYALAYRRTRRLSWLIAGAAAALILAGLALGVLHEVRPGQPAELARASMADELRQYKLVDTDGQPFADAGLNQRDDAKQVGAFNVVLGPSFITRLAHLGWGFAPSVTALGLKRRSTMAMSRCRCTGPTIRRRRRSPACSGCCSSRCGCRMSRGIPRHQNIPLKRAFEVFVPNVCAIDMDTSRQLAVRAEARGPGRHALPVDLSRHGCRLPRAEIQHRDAAEPGGAR